LISSQFTRKVPDRLLRLGLASVLMLSGVKLIDFAGADYAIAVGAIAAALGLAIWGFVSRLGRRPSRAETSLSSD
jgi:Flp pilus assembly protein protease CpaA